MTPSDRAQLNADEARRFFHQIISGVEYCHFHHIVHRDLKVGGGKGEGAGSSIDIVD